MWMLHCQPKELACKKKCLYVIMHVLIWIYLDRRWGKVSRCSRGSRDTVCNVSLYYMKRKEQDGNCGHSTWYVSAIRTKYYSKFSANKLEF